MGVEPAQRQPLAGRLSRAALGAAGRPDGRDAGQLRHHPPQVKPGAQVTVLYEAANPLNASLPAGSLSTMIGGVVVAIGVVPVAVGLAFAAFLILLAGSVDGL